MLTTPVYPVAEIGVKRLDVDLIMTWSERRVGNRLTFATTATTLPTC
ncbi:hypothetical protein PCAR4_900080 [Paraburkholderia caribensis]|nr:hypothetical protein PCAR4_900080 [Paraburkholderia caribensis]